MEQDWDAKERSRGYRYLGFGMLRFFSGMGLAALLANQPLKFLAPGILVAVAFGLWGWGQSVYGWYLLAKLRAVR